MIERHHQQQRGGASSRRAGQREGRKKKKTRKKSGSLIRRRTDSGRSGSRLLPNLRRAKRDHDPCASGKDRPHLRGKGKKAEPHALGLKKKGGKKGSITILAGQEEGISARPGEKRSFRGMSREHAVNSRSGKREWRPLTKLRIDPLSVLR